MNGRDQDMVLHPEQQIGAMGTKHPEKLGQAGVANAETDAVLGVAKGQK